MLPDTADVEVVLAGPDGVVSALEMSWLKSLKVLRVQPNHETSANLENLVSCLQQSRSPLHASALTGRPSGPTPRCVCTNRRSRSDRDSVCLPEKSGAWD